jgi:hypothetical protein
MDWEQIARTVAPTVATGLFGPLGGIVANIVGGILLPEASQKGTVTPQDVANKIATLTDPADLEKLRQAEVELKKFEADNQFRFTQLEAQGVDSARSMRIGGLVSGNRTADRLAWVALVSFLVVTVLVILVVALLIGGVFQINQANTDAWLAVSGLIGSILGYFSANANQVVGFYFGSSSGSAAKSDQIAHQATQALSALARGPTIIAPPPPTPQGGPDDGTPPGPGETKAEIERTIKATVTQTAPAFQPVPDQVVAEILRPVPEAAPATSQPAAPQAAAPQAGAGTAQPQAAAALAPLPDADGRFTRALDFVFHAEGGFSNLPEDHGGATNFGITIGDLQHHRGHPVTVEDVKALTREEAREIYETEYWGVVAGQFLPEALDLCAFDGAVLCGPRRSVRFLQQAMGFTGQDLDGIAGKDTIGAARRGAQADIVRKYAAERRDFHHQTVAAKPDQAKFLNGWLNRVDALEKEALRLVA